MQVCLEEWKYEINKTKTSKFISSKLEIRVRFRVRVRMWYWVKSKVRFWF